MGTQRLLLLPGQVSDLRQPLPDGRQHRMPVLVEVDRGTEAEEVIHRKVRAYAHMIESEWYKQRFHVNSITIAFVVFEDEQRRDKLRAWTLEELQNEDRQLLEHFLFTSQLQPPEPEHIWLSPCWHAPTLEATPVAMLAQRE